MTVRLATTSDEDELFNITLSIHKEVGIFPLSLARFKRMWRLCMDGEWICGVIGELGKLEGAIVLAPALLWYSDVEFLNEQFVYVYPRYRKSSNSKDLLEFAKHEAEKKKMRLMVGLMHRDRLNAKIRLYERQFGEPLGAFFQFDPIH
jgi:hypothetical protein